MRRLAHAAPSRAPQVALLAAAALSVVAAVASVLLDGPTLLRTALCLLAAVATAAQLVRRGSRRGLLDGVLVGTGGVVVVIVLLGIALGASPAGLNPTSWALGLGAVALVALAGCAVRLPARPRTLPAAGPSRGSRSARRAALLLAPWAVVAAVVSVAAVSVSVRSAARSETGPVQMSLASLVDARAVVEVSSDRAVGPLELRTDPGDGSAVTYPLFSVPAGRSVRTEIVVPAEGKVVITLSNPGQVQPLRTLVVSR